MILPAVRLDTSLEILLQGAPAASGGRVLATVVSTAGSTYRKPGARMLIMADGSYLGLLSGGCLESDLKIHAQDVLNSGVARVVEYDMRGPDDLLFGIGAGCEGAMRVLLEPAGPGSAAATGRSPPVRQPGFACPTARVPDRDGRRQKASSPPNAQTVAPRVCFCGGDRW